VNSRSMQQMPADDPAGASRVADFRGFYAWAALGAAAIVVAGFMPSYYFKSLFTTPALPWLLHLHGAVMTSWFALFLLQTCLVQARRVRWHRRLGVLGGVIALLVVVVGAIVAFHAAAREVQAHTPDGPLMVAILGFDCVNLPLFALLIGAGITLRSRSDFHKRLMVLATLTLLGPPIDRIPIDFIQTNHLHTLWLAEAFILLCVGVDTISHRRLHPAFGWGALLIIASFHLAFLGASSEWWIRLGTQLVS
jgi:hypothetical protein